MKFLVTGASGFIGTELCIEASRRGISLIPVVRAGGGSGFASAVVSITPKTDWSTHLKDVDVIIHCAAIVHKQQKSNKLDQYRIENVANTLNLASQAATFGVKRFVYLSSIKVLGEESSPGCPLDEFSMYDPRDSYAISKMEAEIALENMCANLGMSLIIVRPTLVYGERAKANFGRLIWAVKNHLPLPVENIRSKRSFLYVKNLVDFLIFCSVSKAVKSGTYIVSDGESVSTCELIRLAAQTTRSRTFIFKFPQVILYFCFYLLGMRESYKKLSGSLEVVSCHLSGGINWQPPFTLKTALLDMFKVDQR